MRLEDLAPIAISFVVIGVALGIGANITGQVETSVKSAPTTVTNQSLTFSNNTFVSLTNTLIASITSVSNDSVVFTSGNYTLIASNDNSGINVSLHCPACGGPGALNVTYVANEKTTASLSAANATSGIGQVGSWLPTIGLIVAAAVIIGILFSSFYGRRSE